jgi:hypothetical protein
MRLRHLPGRLTCFLLVYFMAPCSPLRADGPADPLRFIPGQAELVFKIENPAKTAENIFNLDLVREVLTIDIVREFYESTNSRRFFQLLGYFEKELGHKRFELLDSLAGGGIVVAAKFTGAPAALVAVQGKDEELVKRFSKIALKIFEQELARQEIKGKIGKGSYRDIETVEIDKFRLALVGPTILFATDLKVLERAIDCHLNGKDSIVGSPELEKARKQLPADPYGWVWVDLKKINSIQAFQEGIKQVVNIPQFFPYLGPMAEMVQRSPYVAVGLYHKDNQFLTAVRMPCGRKELSAKAALFMPEEKDGSLPLLKPVNTVASFSYYLDLAKLWNHKDKWLSPDEAKALDKAAKDIGRFLGGSKLSTLLSQMGTHQRFVQTQTKRKENPGQQNALGGGNIALVLDMRDPAFGKSMETILRAVGLFASFQFNLKMIEHKHGPYTIVSYQLADKKKGKNKPAVAPFYLILSALSPCFVTAGDNFIAASEVELCKELIDLLEKEKRNKPATATTRFQFYSSGIAAQLNAQKDQFRAGLILALAMDPKAAQDQVQKLIALVERIGTLQFETHYRSHEFRFDVLLKLNK